MGQESSQVPERPSLYDRLGGVYNIATVVDDFIDRVQISCHRDGVLGRRRAPKLIPGGRWATRTVTS